MIANVAAPLVLHVVYDFSVGGLENGIVNLVNRLPPDSWRHGIVSLTGLSDTFCNRVKREGVYYLALKKQAGHAVSLYPNLYALFRRLQPAIVHTRNLAALEATLPAALARVPVRIHGEHGRDVSDLDGSSRKYLLLRRAFRPFVHNYIALSHDLERYLRDRVGVPTARIEHICNGVDTTVFAPGLNGRQPIKGCPFTSPHLWLVGTVGRMQAVKAQTVLARAFVRALRLEPTAAERLRLIVVGDGPLRRECEAILRDGNAAEFAWFAGERADVPTLMRGLDCFILPSLAEGISNTILEAMACGLPVIATRVGGNSELVKEGTTGVLTPPDDSEALARKIIMYFRAPALAHRHGHAGRYTAEKDFSLERMVARYHSLYESTLTARGYIPLAAAKRVAMPGGD